MQQTSFTGKQAETYPELGHRPGLHASVELIAFEAFKGHVDWSPVFSATPVYKLNSNSAELWVDCRGKAYLSVSMHSKVLNNAKPVDITRNW